MSGLILFWSRFVKQKKTEKLYKEIVKKEIDNGMTCEEVVKKYPVSMYYARKWSNDVYHKKDLNHYVRDRYKWVVDEFSIKLADSLANELPVCIQEDITDETWEQWDRVIKQSLYDFSKEIIKKN